jgi:hypothetical protein
MKKQRKHCTPLKRSVPGNAPQCDLEQVGILHLISRLLQRAAAEHPNYVACVEALALEARNTAEAAARPHLGGMLMPCGSTKCSRRARLESPAS